MTRARKDEHRWDGAAHRPMKAVCADCGQTFSGGEKCHGPLLRRLVGLTPVEMARNRRAMAKRPRCRKCGATSGPPCKDCPGFVPARWPL